MFEKLRNLPKLAAAIIETYGAKILGIKTIHDDLVFLTSILDSAMKESFQGRFTAAEKLFDKAARLLEIAEAPDELKFKLHAQRGFNFELLGDHFKACDQFELALKLNENTENEVEILIDVFMVFGRCNKNLKDYEKARKCFESALRICEFGFGSDHIKTRQARAALIGLFVSNGDEVNQKKFSLMEQRAIGFFLMPPDVALKKLQSLGLMSDLKMDELKSILERLFGPERFLGEVSTIDIIYHYYLSSEYGRERAKKDGWIFGNQNYRQESKESDDIVAKFCSVVGGAPILKFVKYAGPNMYVDRNPKTQMKWPAENLDDIARMFNSRLKKLNRDQRFYAIDTDNDTAIFLLLTPEMKRELYRVIEFRKLDEAIVL